MSLSAVNSSEPVWFKGACVSFSEFTLVRSEYSATFRCALNIGNMLVFFKVHSFTVNQGGTTDMFRP